MCIQLLRYGLEGLASGLKVMVPCSGLLIRQFSFDQDLSEVTAKAHFFAVRNQASKRSSILEEHKGHVLVMGAGSSSRITRIFESRCCAEIAGDVSCAVL